MLGLDTVATTSAKMYDWTLIDPKPELSRETLGFAHNAPLEAVFRPLPRQLQTKIASPVPPVRQETAQPSHLAPSAETIQSAQVVPLPVPRPTKFRPRATVDAPQIARVRTSQPVQSAVLPSAPLDSQTFFEKLFGITPVTPPESALSYASLDTIGSIAPSARISPAPATGAGTAIYDISAKVVIMPNGERLEAHSGLGDKLDDPRYVHIRMKGATPPGTYVITEREALFHGVRALRLNPVGGSAAIYGRDGLLAHTYMLGPNGDSNGCVSFRNYDRFLQAYLRGEVKRLVVVAGNGQDALPRVVNSRMGVLRRPALPAHHT